MLKFAEQEIVIPNGPYEGRKYNVDRQPYARLFFEAVDSGHYNRVFATGPTQSGKTLTCLVIPIMYHLFELNETVIIGVPDLDMANDKWTLDLKPVLDRSRYADMLPVDGAGSRGGKIVSIVFRNGAVLRFMSGGGSDKSRAGFTSRVVAVTEVDGMDERGGTSDEADKLKQLEGRSRAYGNRKRIYGECTLTTEHGRTYQEISAGTDSKLYICCPLCKGWVRPEREHVQGWQSADTEIQARGEGGFACPKCSALWSEEQRRAANRSIKLVHKGQEIDGNGSIVGPEPHTQTLGFRWSAVNNLFVTGGDVAAELWLATRARDEDNAERELSQFVFATPHKLGVTDMVSLEIKGILARTQPIGRGIVPPETQFITVASDLGKYYAHWVAMAWQRDASARIIDYGRVEVPSEQWGEEKALRLALGEMWDRAMVTGWVDHSGRQWLPLEFWVDSGYATPVVYEFARAKGQKLRPIKGYGSTQDVGQGKLYRPQNAETGNVKEIGEQYHFTWLPEDRVYLVHIDADHWKTWLQRRLTDPQEKPGAMTLYKGELNEHLRLARHLTAERAIEEFVAGKGIVKRWVRDRGDNHWLDAAYISCAEAHWLGARLMEGGAGATQLSQPAGSVAPVASGVIPAPVFILPNGQPFTIRLDR